MTSMRLGRPLGALSALLFAGCPPGHPPGPRGHECEDISDCNAASCGALVPCVRGFCLTEAPKVVVHCTDAGPDAALYECDFWYDCNDADCGDDLVPCIGRRCDPDGDHLSVPCEPPCTDDIECAVALPYDPTCGPCPRAMAREEILGEPCLYPAEEVPPGPPPPECVACDPPLACDELAPKAAVCTAGHCEGIDGVECDPVFQEQERHSAAEVADRAEFVGRLLTVYGTAGPGAETCNDDPEFTCDPGPKCIAPLLLDGIVELRGHVCGAPVRCSDAGCTPGLECNPLDIGIEYDVSGLWLREEATGAFFLEVSSYQVR